MILALRLARRELRGGVRGLGIVLACLALGVAAIAAVGSLRAATDRGLAVNGRQILGGDLEIQTGAQPPPPALLAWLRERHASISTIAQTRSLLVAASGERELIDLKGVDPAWPLVGAAVISPAQPLAAALGERNGRWGLLADRLVMSRLKLRPGDIVRLGEARFTVRGTLNSEPDRVGSQSILGAPVVIAAGALPGTGLVVPGSIVSYAVRLTVPDPASVPGLRAALRSAFPNEGWRVRGPADAAPGIGRAIDQASLFMTLVGLTSLLVGGIGVANGVRAWLDARARTIATLRCLGASSPLVFTVCLIQVMALASLGIAIGVGVGAAAPWLGAHWLAGVLPVPPVIGVYAGPLALAASYGALTAACFALWPLGRAARIPGGALFRDGLIPDHIRPTRAVLAATAGLAAALAALIVSSAHDRLFAIGFCAAALATLALFQFGGTALMVAARAAPRVASPAVRLGIASLHRPGAPTPLMLVSVGLGLSTLAAVALIQGNVQREILDQIPAKAPSFYFVDIQSDQLARFEQIVRSSPGVDDLHEMPSLRARIVAVNGVPADQVRATPDTRWALRGDRGLTYAATPPPNTRLVAGRWWSADYQGPPLVSLDANLARGWRIGLGATIRVNVLGRDIDLSVANLRDIAWRRLGINFVMVASPGLLSAAPQTHIATVRATPSEQGPLLERVSDALPNVTGISVAEVLAAVASLLGQVAAALTVTGAVTLASGALVLVGAVAAGRRQRSQEAVVLKVLGATSAQIRTAWLTEFSTLGLMAGLVAAAVGTAASWAVLRLVLNAPWAFLPGRLAATLIGALAMMVVFGYVGTAAALRVKPASRLRNE